MILTKPTFDPDELVLTKPQILLLLNAIKRRWKKNKRGNILHLAAITAFITSLHLLDDETLKTIWKDIINATNEMITLNQMNRMKGEIPKTQDMVDLVIKKIENGDLF